MQFSGVKLSGGFAVIPPSGPTYEISGTGPTLPATINENQNIVVDVATTNFSGTLYWTILGLTGTINASDFLNGVNQGTFNVSNNTGTFTVYMAEDLTTEGNETFQIQIRTDGYSGTVVATSGIVTINDSSITPPTGQQAYTTSGTYSWVAPTGVTSVSVVSVGGGGSGQGAASGYSGYPGGGGGGLGWKNNITVTPGQSYTVVVGAGGISGVGIGRNGGDSYFINTSTVAGFGGAGGNRTIGSSAGGGYAGDGGGNGGSCIYVDRFAPGSGGGAGGYAGNGGDSYMAGSVPTARATAGQGGGGGGGGVDYNQDYNGAGGGGVGIYGQGANGAAGTTSSLGSNVTGGGGGSGGANGAHVHGSASQNVGGSYGGGGGGDYTSGGTSTASNGGGGAVRLIWGPNRAFPSTNTGDL